MVRKLCKAYRVLILVFIGLLLLVSPIFAIGNPDDIDWSDSTDASAKYNVFENVLETGDWLIVAEGFVDYTVTGIPTDYTASQAFLFELVDTDTVTTLVSIPLNDYGNRPISIYLSATRVTTDLGLTSGLPYIIRITGNPLIFPSPIGNTVQATLAPTDFIDQSLGADSDPPNDNQLRNFLIAMAERIQAYDTPTDDYLASVEGYQYLTTVGADIFIEGIPELVTMCPILFQSGTEVMASEAPESTGTYALTLTPAQKWGTTVANGLTNLGLFLGVNQALAGSTMLFVLSVAFAVASYQMTGSGLFVLLVMSAMPFTGAWLGLMPMALAFIFVIVIIVLLGYYFFSRGVL